MLPQVCLPDPKACVLSLVEIFPSAGKRGQRRNSISPPNVSAADSETHSFWFFFGFLSSLRHEQVVRGVDYEAALF